jgi:hypothetical protein
VLGLPFQPNGPKNDLMDELKTADTVMAKGPEQQPSASNTTSLGLAEERPGIKKGRKRRIRIYICGFIMLAVIVIVVVCCALLIHPSKADVFVDWPSTRYLFVLYDASFAQC